MSPGGWVLVALTLGSNGVVSPQTPPQVEVHCGAPAERLSDTGIPLRWHQPVVRLHVDDSMARATPDPVAIAAHAFAVWQEARAEDLPEFQFATTRGSRLTLEPDGMNTILSAPVDIEGHERDLAVTVTFSDEITGAILETDIVVNSRYCFADLPQNPPRDVDPLAQSGEPESLSDAHDQIHPWATEKRADSMCRDTYDLKSLLAHEAGHVLGLGEDTVNPDATMYYRSEPCDTAKQSLAESDGAAIRELYVAEPPQGSPEVSCSVSPWHFGEPAPRPTGGLWMLALGTLLARCRSRTRLAAR